MTTQNSPSWNIKHTVCPLKMARTANNWPPSIYPYTQGDINNYDKSLRNHITFASQLYKHNNQTSNKSAALLRKMLSALVENMVKYTATGIKQASAQCAELEEKYAAYIKDEAVTLR